MARIYKFDSPRGERVEIPADDKRPGFRVIDAGQDTERAELVDHVYRGFRRESGSPTKSAKAGAGAKKK